MSLGALPLAAGEDLFRVGTLFLSGFGLIALVTVGLAIVFGMMGVINLAHGEFIVVGVYGTALTYHAGVALPVAMAIGVLATVAFGIVVEMTVIRHLYDRLLDSMVATWGLAIVIAQGLSILFGPSLDSVATPMGNVAYGDATAGVYRTFLLPLIAVLVLGGLYLLFTRTEFGVKARATIEDPETARTMGVDTDRMYLVTFAIGSGLAGLAGALTAPLGSISPQMGTEYMVDAFVAVVVGGPSVIVGTLSAASLLSAVSAPFARFYDTFVAQMVLLVVALVALRVLPDGITGYVESWRERRRAES